jgi:hypothetical protein
MIQIWIIFISANYRAESREFGELREFCSSKHFPRAWVGSALLARSMGRATIPARSLVNPAHGVQFFK